MPSIFAPDLFAGQTVLVTGGGSGIGLAIARELGSLGANVAICGRDAGKLEAARAELAGMRVFTHVADIREPEQVQALTEAVVAEFGELGMLVNNAGGQFPAPVEQMSYKGWKAVVENNLNGTFLVTKTVAETAMIPRKRGKIVNIVANMWRGFPGMAHTGAARAGVVNLTQSLAVEWAHHGLLVNAVAPGLIRSTGTDRYPPELMTAGVAATPLKRMGTVEEVAHGVSYLLSPAGDWITGETLCIDGGARIWGDMWQIP